VIGTVWPLVIALGIWALVVVLILYLFRGAGGG